MKKNILITGGGGNLGNFLCEKFYQKNSNIISIFNNKKIKKTKLNSNIDYYKCDLSNNIQCLKVFKKIKKKYKKLDLLILANGKSNFNSSFEKNWYLAFNSNFFASINSIECYEKVFRSKTLIVAISTIAGIKNIDAPIEYSVSKSSLNYYCQLKAKKLAKRKIRLNIISPGNIYQKGNLWDLKMKKSPKKIKKYIKNVSPMNRFCYPDSIYEIIEYLMNEKNNFITGSNFVIDGGQTL